IGPLAEQIKIPSGYETAWEAALGERLQYILVKDRSAVVTALNLLETKKLGRCGFISLADLGSDAESDLTHALLGDYVLADTMTEALAMDPSRTVLTRDGIYIGQDGFIVGGQPQEKEQGLLARRHEIEELAKQVESLEIEKGHIHSLAQNHQNEIQKITKLIADEEHRYQNVSTVLLETEKRLSVLEARQAEVKKRLASLAQGLEGQDAEAGRLADEKESAQIEKEKLDEAASDLITELENADEKTHHLAEELEAAREKRQEYSLLVNTLDGRMKTIKLDETRTDEWLEETESGIKVKEHDLKVSQDEEKSLLARRDEISSSMEGFKDRLTGVEEEVTRERDRVDSLRAELNVQENKLRRERRDREGINERINKQDLDIQEVVFKRQSLLERIENDYGLDLAAQPEDLLPSLEPGLAPAEARTRRDELEQKIEGMGEVNLTAISEEEALKERYGFYAEQYDDLVSSIENLRESISRINRTCKIRFNSTFQAVDQKLREIFPILFDGGEAWLSLTDEHNSLDCGVEIHVHPPGKKLTVMSLLSGGEKALVALALIFSLYLIKASPFCLLDEIDAPLDEANIDRFNRLLQKLGKTSQIILITHNKRTMQIAETLYGVTMEEPGISKLVSVNLSEIEEKLGNDQMVQAS
ncbi:MAG: AAA family ATPase, partial [Deltaproteobacteria bacterium]|nr:AAA family ATPase [Deltaproteobacteria bacterium]